MKVPYGNETNQSSKNDTLGLRDRADSYGGYASHISAADVQQLALLVRNESGRNSLTLSQTVVSVPPQGEGTEPGYLTLSVTR